jgi:phosphoglycerate dehydrogenase-like enzyme
MMPGPVRGAFLLDLKHIPLVWPPEERALVAGLLGMSPPILTEAEAAADPSPLRDVEVLLSGWGCPKLDAAFLARAPRLRALFYAAGSVRHIVTDASWERGVRICSAWGANGVPVAEFTFSQVVICLKGGYRLSRAVRERRTFVEAEGVAGALGSTVGLISLGEIGRRVRELLRSLEVEVVAYDPFLGSADARSLGVRSVTLDELFKVSDVVSVHTPWIPETEGLIRGHHVASMKPYASLINTARGAVIAEPEMIEVLRARPDLQAVLDVTWPEPPATDSPLYDLPNVVMTPHIAGAVGPERNRLGRVTREDLERWLKGEPLVGEVTREHAAILA